MKGWTFKQMSTPYRRLKSNMVIWYYTTGETPLSHRSEAAEPTGVILNHAEDGILSSLDIQGCK